MRKLKSCGRSKSFLKNILFSTILMVMMYAVLAQSVPLPSGPVITNASSETPIPTPATALTTAGGTFTPLVINASSQTPRWKAYAGNVTGTLTLDDASNTTIFNWQVTTTTGEVYATRSQTTVDWTSIVCASNATITSEMNVLGHNDSLDDSLNKTFLQSNPHREFYVGLVHIVADS